MDDNAVVLYMGIRPGAYIALSGRLTFLDFKRSPRKMLRSTNLMWEHKVRELHYSEWIVAFS